ncbi:MAG: carbamate kinase [Bacteroidales bacterium]|jgi:carbamate kinase|nr:carbamate kinase [Bacteroidales bacterium]
MSKLVVVALGGNALLRSNQKGTYKEQIANVTETCEALMSFIKRGDNLIIGHGNGPQVGNVMLQHEAGAKMFDVQAMPMDFCVSETQGSIGYLIETGFRKVLSQNGFNNNIVTLVTRVLVDGNDPMFKNPTKPVGPYYEKEEAEDYAAATGAIFKEDPKGRGWRKVVASPQPLEINNIELVELLARQGNIVVTAGGGGIPVVEKDGYYVGVEAVIDKDLASSLVAVKTKADEFYILTDVPQAYINFRKENEKALGRITVAEAKKYLEEGQFTEGSMAPKMRAAIKFVEATGHDAVITDASSLGNPEAGTRIVK